MLSPDDALALILSEAEPLPPVTLPLAQCLGRSVAETQIAAENRPAFPRAMMDGYAVRLADAGGAVDLRREIAAGDTVAPPPLSDGEAHPIMTGAPVPEGAEAVVPHEATTRDGERVRLPVKIRPGENIVPVAAELRAGASWLPEGAVVTPLAIAVAASLGLDVLPVRALPRVAVVTTGSELASGALAHGQIRDSNGPMLVALLAEVGLTAGCSQVADDAGALAAAISRLAPATDLLLLTGGVSAGAHDEVPGVLRTLGAEILLHHIAQKPGKPMLAAKLGTTLILALPGNPLAAHLGCCRYAIPALRRLAGLGLAAADQRGRLSGTVPAPGNRAWFIPALVTNTDAGYSVEPLVPVSSADICTPLAANAYVRLEPGSPALGAGDTVSFTWIGVRSWV